MSRFVCDDPLSPERRAFLAGSAAAGVIAAISVSSFNKDSKNFAFLTSAPKKEKSESKACNFDPTTG